MLSRLAWVVTPLAYDQVVISSNLSWKSNDPRCFAWFSSVPPDICLDGTLKYSFVASGFSVSFLCSNYPFIQRSLDQPVIFHYFKWVINKHCLVKERCFSGLMCSSGLAEYSWRQPAEPDPSNRSPCEGQVGRIAGFHHHHSNGHWCQLLQDEVTIPWATDWLGHVELWTPDNRADQGRTWVRVLHPRLPGENGLH